MQLSIMINGDPASEQVPVVNQDDAARHKQRIEHGQRVHHRIVRIAIEPDEGQPPARKRRQRAGEQAPEEFDPSIVHSEGGKMG